MDIYIKQYIVVTEKIGSYNCFENKKIFIRQNINKYKFLIFEKVGILKIILGSIENSINFQQFRLDLR